MGLYVSESNWCIRHVWLSGASLWLLRFGFSHSDLQLFELFVFEPQFILHLWVTATWFSYSCCHFICHRVLQPGLCLCMSESFHWFYTHILNSCCRSCLSSSWTVAVFSKISILYFKVFFLLQSFYFWFQSWDQTVVFYLKHNCHIFKKVLKVIYCLLNSSVISCHR